MAIDISYTMFSGIFTLVIGLTAFSWWKHSLAAVIVAFVMILVDGALIQPWVFIVSHPPDGPYPYDQTWQFNMRIISAVWLLLVIFITASLVRIIRHRKFQKDADNPA